MPANLDFPLPFGGVSAATQAAIDSKVATLDTRILFRFTGANMNSTADQAMTKIGTFSGYIIERIVATNASISLTTAAGGIYTAAAKGGTAIVAAGQAYSGLTTSAQTLALTLANTDRRTETPILSLTTAQGAAATADFYVIGTAVS